MSVKKEAIPRARHTRNPCCFSLSITRSVETMGQRSSRPVEHQRTQLVVNAARPGAGLTTVLHALEIGQLSVNQPFMGFDVYEASGSDEAGMQVAISAWTFPAKYNSFYGCGLYPHYYGLADGLIFLVDARDVTADDCSKLERMMSEPESQGKPLLVYANFNDKLQEETPPEATQAAMSGTAEARITEALGLNELSARYGSPIDLQLTCAVGDPEVSGVTGGYKRLMKSIAAQRVREGRRG